MPTLEEFINKRILELTAFKSETLQSLVEKNHEIEGLQLEVDSAIME